MDGYDSDASTASSTAANYENSVASRIAKLDQLFQGKSSLVEHKSIVGKDGLLDGLLLLYEECNNDTLMKNKFIAEFVKKYKSTISEVRKLRIGIKDFVVKDVIGRGHFGEVEVVREKITGDVYALKVLRKQDTLSQQSCLSASRLDWSSSQDGQVAFYEEERDIMAKSSSPWITQLQYAFQDDKNLYLVMEFHPGGDLLSLLGRYDDVFEEGMARFYLAEIVMAIHTLHAMGYVHRDVKPENILIDRTGHVKLADFGSAAKLTASRTVSSKMPVGTPDYICPEVLIKMNSDEDAGQYGVECDWWSLGICAYEMLCEKTPFTDDSGSMVSTYANIMNFKKTLKFPECVALSKDAVDLIRGLLTEQKERLGYEGLCKHKFFDDIDFGNIRQTTPPFIPTVNGKDDTSNFDEFEKERDPPYYDGFRTRREFSGKDLPFLGFTYTRPLAATKDRQSILEEVTSPVIKTNLERKLTVKSKELSTFKEKCHKLESKEMGLKSHCEKLEKLLGAKEEAVAKVMTERDILERDMAHYITEVNSLKRQLQQEKQERINSDNKAMQLLSEISQQSEHSQELREENFKMQVDEFKEVISQLELERSTMSRRVDKLQRELKRRDADLDRQQAALNESQTNIAKYHSNSRCSLDLLNATLEQQREEFNNKEKELQEKLEKAIRDSYMASQELKDIRNTKQDLEEEVSTLKKIQKTACNHDDVSELRRKLQDSEDKMRKMEQDLAEAQEQVTAAFMLSPKKSPEKDVTEKLRLEIKIKDKQIKELTQKTDELDDELRGRRLSSLRHERMYIEDHGKVQSLEKKLREVQNEQRWASTDTLKHTQEIEGKNKKISVLEDTVVNLKSDVSRLEEKLTELRRRSVELRQRKVELDEPDGSKLSRTESLKVKDETIADLKQEKSYMETKVSRLERQIENFYNREDKKKDQVVELQTQLNKSTEKFEKELEVVKNKLHDAEAALQEAQEKVTTLTEREKHLKEKNNHQQERISKLETEVRDLRARSENLASESERVLREKLQEVERERDSKSREAERRISELQMEKNKFEAQTKALQDNNKSSDSRFQKLQEEKVRLKMSAEKSQQEVNEVKRHFTQEEVKVKQLKAVCTELENQLSVLEEINQQYEEKQKKWNSEKKTYEKAVDEADEHQESTLHQHNLEKRQRKLTEDRLKDTSRALDQERSKHKTEVDNLNYQLREHSNRIHDLNEQLCGLEREKAGMEVDIKSSGRVLTEQGEEILKLKEEMSHLITQNGELKSTNFKLTQNFEDAMDKYELLSSLKTDIETQIQSLGMIHHNERYKLESTLGQQTKLIDYLQEKCEKNQPKKKKGIFGTPKPKKDMPVPVRPNVPQQCRELQNALDAERQKNKELQGELLKTKNELYGVKSETLRLKKSDTLTNLNVRANTLNKNPVLTDICLSPMSQMSSSSSLITPHTPGGSTLSADSGLETPSMKPCKERMHHKIPHRFNTGLNSKATKCAMCLGTVHFVRPAAKCSECNVVCHPKCAPQMPAVCGLPTQYVEHFKTVVKKMGRSPAMKGLSSSNLNILEMESWLKIPRSGKQGWDKKWIVLDDGVICIYNSSTSGTPVDRFDLCPDDGEVSVHAAVSASELINVAASDLPHILSLEFKPNTTCWPGRLLYLMASDFNQKQKWVATLEAVVKQTKPDDRVLSAKLLGNTLVELKGDKKLEVNCAIPLNDQILLLGTEEGLYSALMQKGCKYRSPKKIEGMGSVSYMTAVDNLGLVLFISGKGREVFSAKITALKSRISGGSSSAGPLQVQKIDGIPGCTVLDSRQMSDGTYLCAASPDKIYLLKFNQQLGSFTTKKELDATEPCSCLHFGQKGILVGSDKFYKIDLREYTMREFLDRNDSSLAFAAFGAANYESFPVAVLQVSNSNDPEEFLLCFHEFGVFVNNRGQRTRKEDMKWAGLPLAFAYRAPYLFVNHFNSLHVIEVMPLDEETVEGGHTVLDIPRPRYLGPAIASGAVYLASEHDSTVEVMCFQGNLSVARNTFDITSTSESDTKENTYVVDSKSSSKRKADVGFTSPPAIQILPESPRRGMYSSTSESSLTSADYTPNSHSVTKKSRYQNVQSSALKEIMVRPRYNDSESVTESDF